MDSFFGGALLKLFSLNILDNFPSWTFPRALGNSYQDDEAKMSNPFASTENGGLGRLRQ